jgi:hypothetical protein
MTLTGIKEFIKPVVFGTSKPQEIQVGKGPNQPVFLAKTSLKV